MTETKKKSRVKVPTILQMEALECGAACLTMIFAAYKFFKPLEEVRVDCGVSRDGSKASNLLKAARKYGFKASGGRKSLEQVRESVFPAIIHWNFNHFVVLEGYKKGTYYLNDPASGPRKIDEDTFSKAFTGITLEFETGPDFKPQGKKPDIMPALVERLKGSETAILFAAITALLVIVPGLVVPLFSKTFIDEILIKGQNSWMLGLMVAMAGTALIRGAIIWVQSEVLLRMKNKISITASGQFFHHLLKLPIPYFSQRYAGDLSSRMASNESIAQVISTKMAAAFLNILCIIIYFLFMYSYTSVLTLLVLGFSLLNVVILRVTSKTSEDVSNRNRSEYGKLMGVSINGIQTIETLKATAQENDFFSKWTGRQANYLQSVQDIGLVNIYLNVIPTWLTTLSNTVILTVGGLLIMQGGMTIGNFMAFQALVAGFTAPINQLVGLAAEVRQLKGDMNRLDDVLNAKVDELFERDEAILGESFSSKVKLEGAVSMEKVSFGYSILEQPLIQDFSLTLAPGQRVALVGGSGSGKSTVGKLLCGILKPWTGSIHFDGVPHNQVPREVFSNSLAVVDQDISIFHGTVRDNIKLWNPLLADEVMIQAAKDASIHDDITARMEGYDLQVLENGGNFSGGQLQRLEIARALASNPTVLIMDEATSALDPKIEKQVDEAIRNRGCTTLIVAHRLSTIRDADEIIVLDHGRIVQRGKHDDLIAQAESPYAQLIKAM